MVNFDADAAVRVAPAGWDAVLDGARDAAGDPAAALHLAPVAAALLPLPGQGATRQLWEAMAELGAIDLTVARSIEPHLDALAILHQAPTADAPWNFPADSTWGVFAAEGAHMRLDADGPDCTVRLTGRKPWCSLAGGVHVVDTPWASRGLARVTSVAVDFDDVPATPVGPDGWYLERPGFAWGGIGVAAVWWGGAAGLARSMLQAASRREPDQVGRMLLGRADTALHASAAVLGRAASEVDLGGMASTHAWPATVRIRQIVHDACEIVLRAAAHGMGPGPLTGDEEHARRVSDLEVYLRQHKAERDEVVVGDGLLAGMTASWT